MDVSREEGLCSSVRDKGTDETPILVTPGGGIRGHHGKGEPLVGSAVCVGNELGRGMVAGVDIHGEARRDRDRVKRDLRCMRG